MAPNDVAPFLAKLGAVVGQHVLDALEQAYKRGVEDGRHQAAEELSAKVASVLQLSLPREPQDPAPVPNDAIQSGEDHSKPDGGVKSPARAPRGSVEPIVLDALQKSLRGMKPADIAAEHNIPENSARSMLNKLRHAGKAEKRGELWFVAKNEGAAA